MLFRWWLYGCCKNCNSVAGLFLLVLLILFRLCASIMALVIALLQRLGVICISTILIYISLYQKIKTSGLLVYSKCISECTFTKPTRPSPSHKPTHLSPLLFFSPQTGPEFHHLSLHTRVCSSHFLF